MTDRLRIFFHTFILYALTLALGIAAASRHALQPELGLVPQLEVSFQDGLIFFLVFALFTLVTVRFVRTARVSLHVILVITLLAGAQFIAGAWLPWPVDLIAAGVLVLLQKLFPRVLIHNLALMAGIAGISGVLGLSLTPLIAAGLLAVLSIYDVISVYRTRHMLALAGRMMESGAVFGFLVPADLRGFLMPVRDALNQRSVMVLGSGDIGLPLVLAASSVTTSFEAAVMVAGFALGGLMAMQWLFLHQEKPLPMAALPPIAAAAVIGYVIATLLGL
jgi:presenilin-like A22 family membrane protease